MHGAENMGIQTVSTGYGTPGVTIGAIWLGFQHSSCVVRERVPFQRKLRLAVLFLLIARFRGGERHRLAVPSVAGSAPTIIGMPLREIP